MMPYLYACWHACTGTKAELTTMMKSVGETMAMGRTWQESVQKALRGLETGLDGWDLPKNYKTLPRDQLMYKLRVPNPDRFVIMHQVCSKDMGIEMDSGDTCVCSIRLYRPAAFGPRQQHSPVTALDLHIQCGLTQLPSRTATAEFKPNRVRTTSQLVIPVITSKVCATPSCM